MSAHVNGGQVEGLACADQGARTLRNSMYSMYHVTVLYIPRLLSNPMNNGTVGDITSQAAQTQGSERRGPHGSEGHRSNPRATAGPQGLPQGPKG